MEDPVNNESSEINSDNVKMKMSSPEVIDATLKHLAKVNREVNQMNSNELTEKLKYYGLSTGGNDDIRKRRLKNNYRKIKLATIRVNVPQKLMPYYVVIDFEATCLSINSPEFPHEIIEFPAVLINGVTREVKDVFQMYCKPSINPKLTDFCIKLTGITQEQVDAADNFEHVLKCFESWLKSHKLGKEYNYAIVTDAPWDMCKFLFQQCHHIDISYPNWGRKWVNLKRAFASFYKCDQVPLKEMLHYFGMEFEGRFHCGLDDAKNIGRVLVRMIEDGASVMPNEKITTKTKHVNAQSKQMRASFTVIENRDQLSTFENVKRQRGKLEAKLKRELKEKCDNLENEEIPEVLEWVSSINIKDNQNVKRKKKKPKMKL